MKNRWPNKVGRASRSCCLMDGLQSLVFLPLVMLSGCLSYSSRIELRSADARMQVQNANAVEREVEGNLDALGFQRRSEKHLKRMKQGRPELISAWIRDKNRGCWSRFWLGAQPTTVEMLGDEDSILLVIESIDTGDRKKVVETQNVLKKMIENRFPNLKIHVMFRSYLNFPPP